MYRTISKIWLSTHINQKCSDTISDKYRYNMMIDHKIQPYLSDMLSDTHRRMCMFQTLHNEWDDRFPYIRLRTGCCVSLWLFRSIYKGIHALFCSCELELMARLHDSRQDHFTVCVESSVIFICP